MSAMNRRGLLLAGAGLAATVFASPRRALAQAAAPSGPFTLPALPYAFGKNEPHIDAQTMEIHHGRHHAAYVANINNAVKDHAQVAAMPLEQILARLGEMPESIRTVLRNSGGGHANHAMFWQIMGGSGGAPGGELAGAITRDLGGFDKLKADFNGAGARVFGSGWVFVSVDRTGKLAIVSKPNQDTPLMDGQHALFGNDVWEHAYYLKYQNRRPAYLEAWWNVLDWSAIQARYLQARAGSLKI